MIAGSHICPTRPLTSGVFNFPDGVTTILPEFYMIQGYARIVGALEVLAIGGAPPATFRIDQGYQDNTVAIDFTQWVHQTDVFNLLAVGQRTPFNYQVLLKGARILVVNATGGNVQLRLSAWVRNY